MSNAVERPSNTVGYLSNSVELPAGRTIVTLGPEGTDAHAEALKHFSDVQLAPSFPEAMRSAHQNGHLALVAAGYLRYDAAATTDSWVDLHFRHHPEMVLLHVWQSPTKPMCVAVNQTRARSIADIKSLALHPATRAIAEKLSINAAMTFVNAKPIAVERAAAGEFDACIGSVDVVAKFPALRAVRALQPTMVWCLYGDASSVGSEVPA